MKVKTSELTGVALNWAVAMCEGKNPNEEYSKPKDYGLASGWREGDGFGKAIEQYSTDWSQGGPIIERDKISIEAVWLYNGEDMPKFKEWKATYLHHLWSGTPAKFQGVIKITATGSTSLIAAMRCFVASKLGKEVDIPEELL
jgi:Protein of unknown function (DUF2591)